MLKKRSLLFSSPQQGGFGRRAFFNRDSHKKTVFLFWEKKPYRLHFFKELL